MSRTDLLGFDGAGLGPTALASEVSLVSFGAGGSSRRLGSELGSARSAGARTARASPVEERGSEGSTRAAGGMGGAGAAVVTAGGATETTGAASAAGAAGASDEKLRKSFDMRSCGADKDKDER